jgi:ribosomal protein S11
MVFYNKKSEIKSKIFNFIRLKKQYIKKLSDTIRILELLKKKLYQSLYAFLSNNASKCKQTDFLVNYIIDFSFSFSNTVLHITDASGNLKIFCSAGLVDLKGKQKVSRRLVLTRFFSILSLLKSKFLKNNPVALHLKNVGYNKSLIVKKLKKKFFIKIVRTFDLAPYNGCRKKRTKKTSKKEKKKEFFFFLKLTHHQLKYLEALK